MYGVWTSWGVFRFEGQWWRWQRGSNALQFTTLDGAAVADATALAAYYWQAIGAR